MEQRTDAGNGMEPLEGKLTTTEQKLPELQLTQLSRSEKPIGEKILDICPWNNYTLVISGSDQIGIYDEEAKPFAGFKPPLNNKKTIISWNGSALEIIRKVPGKSNSQHIITDKYQSPYNTTGVKLSELPAQIKGFAKEKLKEGDCFFLSDYIKTELSASKVSSISEKYLILTSNEGFVSALKTKNDQGVNLPPSNWQRLGPTDDLPVDLIEQIKKTVQGDEGAKQINDLYYVAITDVGINVFDNDGKKVLFSENMPSIGENITVDPNNKDIVYYCQSSNPRVIKQINMSGDPSEWKPIEVALPKKYESIENFQIDPSGKFFLFNSKNELIILTKDTLEEVKRVPGLSQVKFDSSGHIRAIDEQGYLVIYEADFGELNQEIEKQKIEKLANGIDVKSLFEKAKEDHPDQTKSNLRRLDPAKDKYQEQMDAIIKTAESREDVGKIRQIINVLKLDLKNNGLNEEEVAYIVSGLEAPVLVKEKEFVTADTNEAIGFINGILDTGLSINSVSEAKNIINNIRGSEALLDKDLRIKFSEITQRFNQQRLDFFTKQGDEVTKNLHGTVERIKMDLESFTSKAQMDDWLEFRYPELSLTFGELAKSVPVEASEAYKAVMAIRAELQSIVAKREEQFKLEYSRIREVAAERTEVVVDTLNGDINGFFERLRDRGFTTRAQMEQYLSTSEARKVLELEIQQMTDKDPDLAKKITASFKVKLSNMLLEVEHRGKTSIAQTGQQMVFFGEILFPKWEAKVKQKTERKINLIFSEDSKSRGPGIRPSQFQGDISIAVQNSEGKVDQVRLYEGWQEENEWRFGTRLYTKLGLSNPPSYVTAEEFGKIRSVYTDWSKGDSSQLRRILKERQEALREFYKTKPENESEKKEWVEKRDQQIKEYADFYMANHIPLLKRIDQIRNQPEIEHTNGRGFVPEWQSHWVTDIDTEKNLETMARRFKMQLDLSEGCLNLKGHAGVGKDVLIKMFCNLTNRPYFGFDGTRWTTEYDLSEDVVLESKDGASQTVKVPSIILTGITTPGAVVYFNEFNAMPEQTQIFLHSLTDEKRSVTLKTSSGTTVKSLPNVLLVSSINPNYPGTFDIQPATRSRMVDLQINYPPLTRKNNGVDSNPNPLYNPSEALRMAREINSLSELTYEADMKNNDYVKMWDHYVNGVDNGSMEPNPTQKFDIDASLAIIQFVDRLRQDFIKYFEKTGGSRGDTLPVTYPVTGRELRRMAWELNQMTPEQKATANPEGIARSLIDTYYLSHFDKTQDSEKIRTAMSLWTSQKRVRK